MKHQYFGDINDYRKYGLLRALAQAGQLRLGVCWMLTPDDGRNDGEFRRYLEQPERWRHYDPELYDGLRQLLTPAWPRSVAHAEEWELVPEARYHREIVPVGMVARRAYFDAAIDALSGTDMVFFDPDNGIEVPSVGRGSAAAPKYVRWNEIGEVYRRGQSVLIYQHYPRKPRERFEEELCGRLRDETGAHRVDVFATKMVAFVALSHERHEAQVGQAAAALTVRWGKEFRQRHVRGVLQTTEAIE